MKYYLLLSSLVGFNICFAAPKQVVQNRHFAAYHDLPKMAGEDHYQTGLKAFEEGSFVEAINHFRIVYKNFSAAPYASDASYYLGVSLYNLGELDVANDAFTNYLRVLSTPKYFQQAIEYKFSIAERFKNGEKKSLLGAKIIPKWFSGKALAVEIYDEVIAALPSHEFAAQALYAKGQLLWEMKEFRESVEAFQTLIKRFPRHEHAPESYLAITKVYLEQSQYEFQNPDLITFGEINLRKFALDFPREERIAEMKSDVDQIKEVYAKGLYETGQFYERINKAEASLFCYKNAKEKFPETQIAKKCEERIAALDAQLKRQAIDTRDPGTKNRRVKMLSPKKTV
jgi:outer membrane protein assembly factor BamD (BamD/ComL family)